jgi:signal transduction histidine kinase
VRKNLLDDIHGKDFLIESTKLPVLNLVPLQFHQLLVNLFANSIKYGKPGLPAHIKISANLLTTPADLLTVPPDMLAVSEPGSEVDGQTPGKYWKIDIEDNGIGFKQEYAERIFELFQRLHGRTEYEGTGVGLAICKKIVQNHRGSIKAYGRPGVGATFSIFLPYPG